MKVLIRTTANPPKHAVHDCGHVLCTGRSQYEGLETGISKNSISPLKSEEFVPPKVKTPPGDESPLLGSDLASQNENSGLCSWSLFSRFCQKGTPPVLAIVWKARPKIPEVCPSKRPL